MGTPTAQAQPQQLQQPQQPQQPQQQQPLPTSCEYWIERTEAAFAALAQREAERSAVRIQCAFRRLLAALDATVLRHPNLPWMVTREGAWRELRWRVEEQAAPVQLTEAETAAMVAQAREEAAQAREDGRSLPGHIGARTRAMQDGVTERSAKSSKKAAQRERKKAREAAAASGKAPTPGAAPPAAAGEEAEEDAGRAAKRAQIARDVAEARAKAAAVAATAAWQRLARRRSLLAATRLQAWRRMVQRMVRPWWGGSQARLDWRCLVLRLFEPSDDPAHPRVVDDLLAYRGMQRAFEARSDYRGCRDMEAYYDEYDPDRAYHGAIAEPGAWYDDYAAGFGDA
jgi:hypothetical protein